MATLSTDVTTAAGSRVTGSTIRQARLAAGLSQVGVARVLGVASSTVRRLELHDRGSEVTRLAAAFALGLIAPEEVVERAHDRRRRKT